MTLAKHPNWFLTPREKEREVAAWLAERAEDFDPERPGTPDPDIYDLTDRLNALTGICTVKACAGHGESEGKFEQGLSSGRVWVRVTGGVLTRFQQSVHELIAHTEIEEACVIYGRSNYGSPPVISVVFAGNERRCLPTSTAIITDFFSKIARDGHRPSLADEGRRGR